MASREVDEAVGEAPAHEEQQGITSENALARRADELRRVLARPSDRESAAAELARVEAELASARAAQWRSAAEHRLLGIRRAYGSVTANLDADEQRVREKIAELAAAITRLNERYAQAEQLRAEAAALSDRFDLESPPLARTVPPARRGIAMPRPGELLDHAASPRPLEECEHQLRSRRTYAEIARTEGHAIIATAGLKPFPPLTSQQERTLAARARDAESLRRQLAGLPRIPSDLPVPGGSI